MNISEIINDMINEMPVYFKSNMSNLELHLGFESYEELDKHVGYHVTHFEGMKIVCNVEYPLNSIVISPKKNEPPKDDFTPLDIFTPVC